MKLKQWQNTLHVIVNANSSVQYVIQIKNETIKHTNLNVKIIVSAKKVIKWNLSTCICENGKYLEIIADTSVTEFDEIIIVMDNVSTKKINTIGTSVRSTASITCHSKKVTDSYISHTVLLAIVLLLIITIIFYHYPNKKAQYKNEN